MTRTAEQRLLALAERAVRESRALGRKLRLPQLEKLQKQIAGFPPATPALPDPRPTQAPPSPPPLSPSPISLEAGDKAKQLAALAGEIVACQKCAPLAASRTQVVVGVGNPDAELMFIGEAPGAEEDRQGEPFVGPAGSLLTKVIETMGLRRDAVYLANILKCRPHMPPGKPGNRPPQPEEMATCLPYLERQIAIIQPKAIVALGGTALNALLGGNRTVGNSRGRWLEYQGIPLRPTYHPSYILRRNMVSDKRLWWEDMLAVLEQLGHPITEKQRQFFQAR